MNEPIKMEIKGKLAENLRKASERAGMSFSRIIEQAVTKETERILAAARIPKNAVLVTLIRERASENERWRDNYLFQNMDDPEKTFREAIREFLLTDEGTEAIKASSEDFNWGDAVMYTPTTILEKHGIYEIPEGERITFTPPVYTIEVMQDELLIPDEYVDRDIE